MCQQNHINECFKMWGHSGISGFLHDFKIYEGKIPNTKVSECGVSGDVVLHLTKTLSKHKNYKIFANNFFTGIPLVQTLLEDGVFLCWHNTLATSEKLSAQE